MRKETEAPGRTANKSQDWAGEGRRGPPPSPDSPAVPVREAPAGSRANIPEAGASQGCSEEQPGPEAHGGRPIGLCGYSRRLLAAQRANGDPSKEVEVLLRDLSSAVPKIDIRENATQSSLPPPGRDGSGVVSAPSATLGLHLICEPNALVPSASCHSTCAPGSEAGRVCSATRAGLLGSPRFSGAGVQGPTARGLGHQIWCGSLKCFRMEGGQDGDF